MSQCANGAKGQPGVRPASYGEAMSTTAQRECTAAEIHIQTYASTVVVWLIPRRPDGVRQATRARSFTLERPAEPFADTAELVRFVVDFLGRRLAP